MSAPNVREFFVTILAHCHLSIPREVGGPSSCELVFYVFCYASCFKVMWITTRWIIAFMSYRQ